jgi:hypothetical protein
MRVLGGAALFAATVLALTGCGSQATPPSATPSVTVAPAPAATTPTPTVTAPETITATPDPTPTAAAADPNRPKGQCPNSSLGVSIVYLDAGAGSLHYKVLFTNTSGSACELRGAPGVSVVGDGNGTRLGAAATGLQTGVKTWTLQSGDTISAALRITDIGTNGGPLTGCTVRRGDGYRVYPPHSGHAFFVQDPKAVACVTGPVFMTVGPVGAS